MKAVRFHDYGDSDVLRYEDVEQPDPDRGEVRIRVAAAAFNPVDGGIRGGYLQGPFPVTLPHIPGIEVSGTVDALGEGVDGFAVGDAVVGFLPMVADGAAAEYAIAPAEILAPAPTSIPLPDVAALPMVGLTAWQALFDHAGLTAGQRLLINGAGGAVGGYAVQLAKRAGAHVIATASPSSSERVRSAGADEVIDHTTAEVTVAEPVDVLLNLARIAPDELAALVALVRPGGVIVNTVPTLPTVGDEERGVRAVGLFVRSDAEQLAHLVELVDRGELRVDVAERVPLAALADVHARSDAGALPGKVVVVADTGNTTNEEITMSLTLDPEIAAALAPMLESGLTPPPVGDIVGRRAMWEPIIGAASTAQPIPADVTTSEHHATARDGAKITMRWYAKDGATPGPAVLFFHGGGYILGHIDLFDGPVSRYVSASGVPMLSVDYRRAPEHPFPTPLEDAYAALRWLHEHAAELGVDPDRIGVMGDSAGGGMAAALTILARERGGPKIARQILLMPMLDDRTRTPDPHIAPYALWSYDDSATAWPALLGAAAGGPAVPATAAPARLEDATGLPPAYIEVGQLDVFRDEDVAYATKLSRAGVPVELHLHPGAPHEFDSIAFDSDVARRAIADRVRVLKSI